MFLSINPIKSDLCFDCDLLFFSFDIVLNFTQLFPDLYDIPYLYCLKMSDLGDITKLKVPELKSLLKERGLPISGTKQVLIERLGIWIAGTDTK